MAGWSVLHDNSERYINQRDLTGVSRISSFAQLVSRFDAVHCRHRHAVTDAIVVGAGPNGLAAAITLAEAGHSVQLIEAADTVGGGTRSAELTLPGFVHDVCSAIHPFGLASPVFQSFSLDQHGLEWLFSPAELAHPFDDGSAAILTRSIEDTGKSLGADASAWQNIFGPLVNDPEFLPSSFVNPLRAVRRPGTATTFGLRALRSAKGVVNSHFKEKHARGLFGGIAAHSFLKLDQPTSAAIAFVLGSMGHTVGWPFPQSGSQAIADALASRFRSLGGEIITGTLVESIDDLTEVSAMLFDVTPWQLTEIAGHRLPEGYRRRLNRYRYGPGSFKIDFALDGPIPWTSPECNQAATVHIGGTFEEIAHAEHDVVSGRHPERPFVLLAQTSLFDPSRAPNGKHTVWAYSHVPNGSTVDMTDRITSQIERFAPGFRDRILATATMNTTELELSNPNYIGGDISGGVHDLRQILTRPVVRVNPWSTPDKRIYICSSSTPPGAGVHGICGYHAARSALRRAW